MISRSLFLAPLICLALLLVGCSSTANLGGLPEVTDSRGPTEDEIDPTPVVVRESGPLEQDKFESREVKRSLGFGGAKLGPDTRVVRVFYATNRVIKESPSGRYFTSGRADRLRYGFCDVTIPPDHRLGNIEEPAIWRLQANDPNKHVTVLGAVDTPKERFWTLVSDHASSSGKKRALVYVHGYYNSFTDAAKRAAQLKYDLVFEGPVIFFSWPSRASALLYLADSSTVEWAAGDLATFLDELRQVQGLDEVILVAHSMGARGLSMAVQKIAGTEVAKPRSRFTDVILAAPDIDRDFFVRDLMPALKAASKSVTLYASQNDVALTASRTVHSSLRAGSAAPEPVIASGLATIDATSVDTSFVGHTYFAENRSIVSDIFYAINEKLPPARRANLQAVKLQGGQYWKFRQ